MCNVTQTVQHSIQLIQSSLTPNQASLNYSFKLSIYEIVKFVIQTHIVYTRLRVLQRHSCGLYTIFLYTKWTSSSTFYAICMCAYHFQFKFGFFLIVNAATASCLIKSIKYITCTSCFRIFKDEPFFPDAFTCFSLSFKLI